MIPYPHFNPVALKIGSFEIYWYGLCYLLAFLFAYLLAKWRIKHYHLPWSQALLEDFIFYAALGVIIGGRFGYMLFYQPQAFLYHPFSVFAIWQGGMSFHGGLLGVLCSLYLFSQKYEKPFFEVTDFATPLVPIGLALGRLGNFINGELWGRVTTVPWGMVFPEGGPDPRHPSQLYELTLEGIFLFFLIWVYAARKRPTGRVSGLFLMGYAGCRVLVECFREPDAQLGYIAFHFITMGQLLSIPLFIFGWYLWRRAQ